MAPSWFKRQSLKTRDDQRTKAAEITLRQSIYPLALVTTLFFLWGFSYGLLDTLNKHFQNTLHITRARSSGLQAAYFGYVHYYLSEYISRLIYKTEHILLPLLDMPIGFCVTMAISQCLFGASAFMASVL